MHPVVAAAVCAWLGLVGNWLGLMLGSVGVVLVLLVTTLVFLWRRKHPEVPLAETGGYVIT